MARALLSPDDTGKLFDAGPETMRRLYRAGKIPGYKVGRLLRFDPDEVREALRSQPAADAPRTTDRVEPDFDALGAD
jgi:excisionase family DNA binding protein